jgi:hypothetical protein
MRVSRLVALGGGASLEVHPLAAKAGNSAMDRRQNVERSPVII